MDRPQSKELIRRSYDSVASQYALNLFNELEGKPIDRELLDDFADRLRGKGTVCDVGCGPGQIASYLYGRGLSDVCGLDLSPAMVETAHFLFFETAEIVSLLRKARFSIDRVVEREPYPAVEYPSQRAYILART